MIRETLSDARCSRTCTCATARRQRPCAFQRYLYFAWKDYPTVGVLPGGFGSMYNDGGRCCNVVYTLDMDRRCMTFVALRDIEEGEELLIDYQAMTRPELKCEF